MLLLCELTRQIDGGENKKLKEVPEYMFYALDKEYNGRGLLQ